jgi:glucose-1-phosphate cytidylyltransferase
MKVVILAGGFGTRLSEETEIKPKPMIEIGGMPILWHIMKTYSFYGYNDFIICLGYKGYYIKEFFAHYFLHQSDVTFDFRDGKGDMQVHRHKAEPWTVTLIDTGTNTMTGGRVKRIQKYIGNETFMLTYGDGVGNVNIAKLIEFHVKKGKKATLTSVQPVGRFGAINVDESGLIKSFKEKPVGDGSWVNGGFFVLEPSVFSYIEGESTVWEREPLERIAVEGELVSYHHTGFWMPMDTLRDKRDLEKLWESGNPPWKIWND